MLLFLIIGLLIGAASVIFILQNVSPVTVTFFTWQLHGSLALVLLLALLAGILIMVLFMLPSIISTKFLISNLRKQNKKLSQDVDTLRTSQPLSHPTQRVVEKQTSIASTEVHEQTEDNSGQLP